jgi:hypothetical protein
MNPMDDDSDGRAEQSRDFERVFAAVLDRAATYGEIVHNAVVSLHPPDSSLNQMPESTVWRLHLTATASFEASIQCLRTRYSSLGGYVVLRGLLEAWAHLDFIADNSQGGSPALRAIRYELGAHQEWENSAHDAPAGHPSPMIAQDNHDLMLELWQEKGGQGNPSLRNRKHVQTTLTSIATREQFDWLRGLYRSTSAATHMLGVNFLLQSTGETTAVVWATPAQRSSWLTWATACFDYLSRTTVGLMGGEDVEEMQIVINSGAHAIVDDPVVRAPLRAESDKALCGNPNHP